MSDDISWWTAYVVFSPGVSAGWILNEVFICINECARLLGTNE